MNVRPQVVAAALAALALVPVVLYQFRLEAVYLALSVVSVLVIVASLYAMFSPAEDRHAS